MEPRIGRIYPVLPMHLERIFAGKDVFCKFIGTGPKGKGRTRISAGEQILFYSSRGLCEIVGEAKIGSLEYLTPEETVGKYRERLFITPDELAIYASRRNRAPNSHLLVVVLKQIRKYRKRYKLDRPITMSGMDVTREKYHEIVSKIKQDCDNL